MTRHQIRRLRREVAELWEVAHEWSGPRQDALALLDAALLEINEWRPRECQLRFIRHALEHGSKVESKEGVDRLRGMWLTAGFKPLGFVPSLL